MQLHSGNYRSLGLLMPNAVTRNVAMRANSNHSVGKKEVAGLKRIAALAVVLAVLLSLMAVPAAAAPPLLEVRVNNHPVMFDAEPIIVNDRSLVPFRAIFEALGARVEWEARSRTVTATRQGTTVVLQIDNPTAYVNGAAVSVLDGVVPIIHQGRTMVPLRFISESLGLDVKWDAAQRIANVVDDRWPARGGTLQSAMWSAPDGKFNPIIQSDLYTSFVTDQVFFGLFYLDDKFTPRPGMAKYWDVSADNRTFTFYLRDGLRFHDGVPLTAEDVRFTFEAIMHPDYKGPRNVGFEVVDGYDAYREGRSDHVSGIKVIDSKTISFTLTEPSAPFFTDNLGYGIVPRHLYRDVPIADWGLPGTDPNLARPIGSGPFKWSSSAPGQFYILEAFDDFALGRPYIDRIIWKVLAQSTALAQLEVSAIDFADIDIRDLDTVAKMPHMQVIETPQLGYQYLGFNTRMAPFDDVRMRQAVAYAVDTEALVNDLLDGHGAQLFAPIHPLTWAYTEDGLNRYDYNPQKAGEILDSLGWTMGPGGVRTKDGKRLEVELIYPSGNQVRERSAPVIQAWLKAVGMDVTLTKLEFASLLDRILFKHNHQMALVGFSLSVDPDPMPLYGQNAIGDGQFNFAQWTTPLSEELMLKGQRTLDIEQRREHYVQWQKHYAEEIPNYLLYTQNNIWGINKRVKNIKASPAQLLWNSWEQWLE